tara:strand:+ start:1680 stop:2846 length:1167 start_codon:yes stop_codon:yes gene_type:complete
MKENRIKKWINQLTQKRSRVGSILAWQQVGRPVWTPRQYDFLSEEGYHKNVIVYRCVNLIARNLATVPWKLYQGDEELKIHPLFDLIKNPNPMHTRVSLLESMASHILLSGNCYLEAVGDNKIDELYLWRPDRVQVVPGEGGVPEAYIYRVNGQERKIYVDSQNGQSSVLHIKTFHPLNDWYGMSAIEAAASAIDQHNAVGSHNLALLQNGGRPTGALVIKPGADTSTHLTEQERQTLKDELRLAYEGSDNAGRMMVLEGNMEWREMGLNPKDLDFVNGKHLSAREIAQAYGIPGMLVGVPGESTFANYKEARLHLWEDTILPTLDKVMAEINRWICPYYGDDIEFRYDADSIPALAIRRESLWSKIQNSDFLTTNEKRAALGYGPTE